MEQGLPFLVFLSTPAFNRYYFLCLEMKAKAYCVTRRPEVSSSCASQVQSISETKAAAATHREFYYMGPRFLDSKAVLSPSCQDRLLPAAVSQLSASLHCFTLLPHGFQAFLLPVSYVLLCLHTYRWTLRTSTAPLRGVWWNCLGRAISSACQV